MTVIRGTILKAAAAGVVLGAIALAAFLGAQALAGPPSPKPTPDLSQLPPGATVTYEGDEPVIEVPITPLADKPYFKGRLADFEIVGMLGPVDRGVCPQSDAEFVPEEAARASELYSRALDPGWGAACADGTVVSVTHDRHFGSSSTTATGGPRDEMSRARLYFRGVPQIHYDAPRERLQLLTVAGRPAIAELSLVVPPAYQRLELYI